MLADFQRRCAYIGGNWPTSTDRSDERQEQETAINKQQTEAQQTVREINDEVGKLDAALREYTSKLVRNK